MKNNQNSNQTVKDLASEIIKNITLCINRFEHGIIGNCESLLTIISRDRPDYIVWEGQVEAMVRTPSKSEMEKLKVLRGLIEAGLEKFEKNDGTGCLDLFKMAKNKASKSKGAMMHKLLGNADTLQKVLQCKGEEATVWQGQVEAAVKMLIRKEIGRMNRTIVSIDKAINKINS